MSATILFAVMRSLADLPHAPLRAPHRLVLLILADAADEQGRAWPSAGTVARRAGLSLRTVNTVLADVRNGGWVALDPRPHQTGVYTFNLDRFPAARSSRTMHAPPPSTPAIHDGPPSCHVVTEADAIAVCFDALRSLRAIRQHHELARITHDAVLATKGGR